MRPFTLTAATLVLCAGSLGAAAQQPLKLHDLNPAPPKTDRKPAPDAARPRIPADRAPLRNAAPARSQKNPDPVRDAGRSLVPDRQDPGFSRDAVRLQSQEAQDRKTQRINASDQRAVRSVCDASCTIRTPTGQPKDPFASLPDYTDEPGPRLPGADDPEP